MLRQVTSGIFQEASEFSKITVTLALPKLSDEPSETSFESSAQENENKIEFLLCISLDFL
jgi:hypothetical protein